MRTPFTLKVFRLLIILAWALVPTILAGRLFAAEAEAIRNVDNAITTTIRPPAPALATTEPGLAPYLGVNLATNRSGQLILAGIADESPAARAGLQAGDIVTKVAGKAIRDVTLFREWLQQQSPGDAVEVSVKRGGKGVQDRAHARYGESSFETERTAWLCGVDLW